jgi:hypothetical protein
MSSDRHGNWNWRDVPWALATSAQGGLLIALPVVAGLALGYWLDG